jgi:hypothetical protein
MYLMGIVLRDRWVITYPPTISPLVFLLQEAESQELNHVASIVAVSINASESDCLKIKKLMSRPMLANQIALDQLVAEEFHDGCDKTRPWQRKTAIERYKAWSEVTNRKTKTEAR